MFLPNPNLFCPILPFSLAMFYSIFFWNAIIHLDLNHFVFKGIFFLWNRPNCDVFLYDKILTVFFSQVIILPTPHQLFAPVIHVLLFVIHVFPNTIIVYSESFLNFACLGPVESSTASDSVEATFTHSRKLLYFMDSWKIWNICLIFPHYKSIHIHNPNGVPKRKKCPCDIFLIKKFCLDILYFCETHKCDPFDMSICWIVSITFFSSRTVFFSKMDKMMFEGMPALWQVAQKLPKIQSILWTYARWVQRHEILNVRPQLKYRRDSQTKHKIVSPRCAFFLTGILYIQKIDAFFCSFIFSLFKELRHFRFLKRWSQFHRILCCCYAIDASVDELLGLMEGLNERRPFGGFGLIVHGRRTFVDRSRPFGARLEHWNLDSQDQIFFLVFFGCFVVFFILFRYFFSAITQCHRFLHLYEFRFESFIRQIVSGNFILNCDIAVSD